MYGTISPETFQIYMLLAVSLSGNQLTGTITSTIGYPSLTLRGLGLEKNSICGTTPSSVG